MVRVFHQLQVLNLWNNSFSGSIPSLFSNISTLQTLHLACNSLRGADPRRDWKSSKSAIEDWVPTNCIPASFGNLKNHLKLDLFSNNLGGSLPPEVGNLKAMIHIDLSANKLSNDIPKEIGS
ncbi:hypothetical protein RDI58_019256 [Solanum bulbocastanum]|uniref:Uncharacterized protein n=1 Tax=Solanum bulbocastanum TaxID=147425 RepID=A0AAN8T4B0_SOLBU